MTTPTKQIEVSLWFRDIELDIDGYSRHSVAPTAWDVNDNGDYVLDFHIGPFKLGQAIDAVKIAINEEHPSIGARLGTEFMLPLEHDVVVHAGQRIYHTITLPKGLLQ